LLHERAIEKIRAFAGASMRLEWAGCIPSPITGAEGNREFLACLR
jgi:23S rRNA (cytidine1920-2'-O)/16S rRNA (cytidine1409-2'-O)-methyltransferase